MTDDLFRPASVHWEPVSAALATARRIIAIPPLTVLALILTACAVLLDVPSWISLLLGVLAVVALAVTAWVWFWASRNQRRWAYAEAEDDLLVTSGVMFRRLVAVPYGRMQFVDMSSGPLARRLGIATVTLHTASTETAADIPGVPLEEARRLRNRLTELGEAHGAGV